MRIGKYNNWENLKPLDFSPKEGDLVVRIHNKQYADEINQGDIVLVDDGHLCGCVGYWAKLPHQLGDIIDTQDLKPLDSIPEEGMLAVRLHTNSVVRQGQVCHIKPLGGTRLTVVSKDMEEKWAKYEESWAAYPMNLPKEWDFEGKFGDFKEFGDFSIELEGKTQYLVRVLEENTTDFMPQICDGEFKNKGLWKGYFGVKIKKATEQESKHMQSCIDAGEYVPPTFYGKTKDFNGDDGYYHIKGKFKYMAKFVGGMSQGYLDSHTFYGNFFPFEDFNITGESEIRPCTPEEIKIIDLSMENGTYTEQSASEQLDPKNLIVGEIYTCKGSVDSYVYNFTGETERIPFYRINEEVSKTTSSSDFQGRLYSEHALASEEQKQKFYKLFPKTPDKPEIEGYEVIEFREVEIGELYASSDGLVLKNQYGTGNRWVVRPIKEDTYWQDLYGECFSHAIVVEEAKNNWKKTCQESSRNLLDKDRQNRMLDQDISKLKRSHAKEIELTKRQHNQEVDKLQTKVTELSDSLETAKLRHTDVIEKIQSANGQLIKLELERLKTQAANKKLKEELAAAKENIFKKMWRNIV